MVLSVPFYPYNFIRNILDVPICPIPFCPHTVLSIPFCPYHFVRYHFVLEPSEALPAQSRSKKKDLREMYNLEREVISKERSSTWLTKVTIIIIIVTTEL